VHFTVSVSAASLCNAYLASMNGKRPRQKEREKGRQATFARQDSQKMPCTHTHTQRERGRERDPHRLFSPVAIDHRGHRQQKIGNPDTHTQAGSRQTHRQTGRGHGTDEWMDEWMKPSLDGQDSQKKPRIRQQPHTDCLHTQHGPKWPANYGCPSLMRSFDY